MASIVEGYNYDIFISYRQKDNKGDRWVSEFVEALKTELESTFKEEISVYFDINPHDGLLETHDVDESLKEKLKCLVFIPIISRTYCDPKSFAWEHEFNAFVEQASQDKFGLKIKLPNGNVASRVLPIQIHDLDNTDIKLCESILGGVLRGVEFIYKEPGVNKPLTAEDDEKKNLNNTKYRIQINKTANAINEILSGLKSDPSEPVSQQTEVLTTIKNPVAPEKSIIVLPFENMSSDPEQEYFSDGLTEEIITDLSHIHDLLVISRNSTMTFKGSGKTTKEIAEKVNVRYVLEGSVRKAGNNLRITAQLIDALTDTHLWADKYGGTLDDVFDIQEKVSRSIVGALKVKITSDEEKHIVERPIDNVQAYECYLRAIRELQRFSKESIERALGDLQIGLNIIGDNALLFTGMALVYCHSYETGIRATEETLAKAEEYVFKVLRLEPNSSLSYSLLGRIERFRGSALKALKHFKRALDIDPNDVQALFWLGLEYFWHVGRPNLAKPILRKLIDLDPLSPLNHLGLGLYYSRTGEFDNAIKSINNALELEPNNVIANFWIAYTLLWSKEYDKAYALINRMAQEESSDPMNKIFIGWLLFLESALKGEKRKALESLNEDVINFFWNDADLPVLGVGGFALIDDKKEAIRWLEHSINKGFINYPHLLEIDPFLENIRGEERFKKLMEEVKYKWENFEV